MPEPILNTPSGANASPENNNNNNNTPTPAHSSQGENTSQDDSPKQDQIDWRKRAEESDFAYRNSQSALDKVISSKNQELERLKAIVSDTTVDQQAKLDARERLLEVKEEIQGLVNHNDNNDYKEILTAQQNVFEELGVSEDSPIGVLLNDIANGYGDDSKVVMEHTMSIIEAVVDSIVGTYGTDDEGNPNPINVNNNRPSPDGSRNVPQSFDKDLILTGTPDQKSASKEALWNAIKGIADKGH
jgi:hypothetical protein